MTKQTLENIMFAARLEIAMQQKGYSYFKKGDYNLNIVGIRSNQGQKVTHKFDDFLVDTNNVKGVQQKTVYAITTDPGLYYMNTPCNN